MIDRYFVLHVELFLSKSNFTFRINFFTFQYDIQLIDENLLTSLVKNYDFYFFFIKYIVFLLKTKLERKVP